MMYDRRDCTDAGDDPEIISREQQRKVVYEKRIDPKHPYCTNWPIPKNLTKEEE